MLTLKIELEKNNEINETKHICQFLWHYLFKHSTMHWFDFQHGLKYNTEFKWFFFDISIYKCISIER